MKDDFEVKEINEKVALMPIFTGMTRNGPCYQEQWVPVTPDGKIDFSRCSISPKGLVKWNKVQ
jgi:hypothetical protein